MCVCVGPGLETVHGDDNYNTVRAVDLLGRLC